MNTSRHQRAGIELVVLFVLAFIVCMPICDFADHHGSSVGHPFLCAIDMPQVFRLLILMISLFLIMLSGVVAPPAPTFALLKPPRFVPLRLTAR